MVPFCCYCIIFCHELKNNYHYAQINLQIINKVHKYKKSINFWLIRFNNFGILIIQNLNVTIK